MQIESAIWIFFLVNLVIAILVTALVEIIFVLQLVKHPKYLPDRTKDKKQEVPTIWGIGLIPGILTFILLSFQHLYVMDYEIGRVTIGVTIAIVIISTSYFAGRLATKHIKLDREIVLELDTIE